MSFGVGARLGHYSVTALILERHESIRPRSERRNEKSMNKRCRSSFLTTSVLVLGLATTVGVMAQNRQDQVYPDAPGPEAQTRAVHRPAV